jgi:S1-C subfamily serine protease
MRKVLVLAVLLSLSYSAFAQDWSLHVATMEKSVFRLESTKGRCSAVLINEKEHILLTAAHCISEDKQEAAQGLTVETKHAALLKVGGLNGTQLPLRSGDIKAGTPVAVVGFGLGARSLKYGFGWISDERDTSIEVAGDSLYFVVVGTVPGHSGGALIDATGKLVAIVQGAVGRGEAVLGVGSPTEVVEDFVKPHWPKL